MDGGSRRACYVSSRRFYDPSVYRIITFDQRGCGRSTPHGELEYNTSQDLITDIEAISEYLDNRCYLEFHGVLHKLALCTGISSEGA